MENKMYGFKRIGINEIEIIKELFAGVFTIEPWNDDWSDEKQLHNYITDLIGNRNSLSIGLYDGDELIGLSLGSIIHWCTGTEYYVFEFCIKTSRQGKGIGTEFLNLVSDYAKTKGATHVFLQTERTVPAYDFYIKNGFTDLKDHVSLFKNFD